jgi:hypothetical protein
MDIQRLIEIGGNEWIKNEHHRVYFNSDIQAKLIGLTCSYYNTGNIRSASLNGDQISNSEAKRILSSIGYGYGKLWYDVKTDSWGHRDIADSRAQEIIDAITAEVKNADI